MDENQETHIGNALIFMCRYSFGRQTSADMASNSALKSLWEYVPENQKRLILDEIEAEVKFPSFEKDNFVWEDFLEWEKNDD